MNCKQAQQLFNTYLDGELGGTLAAELGAHQLKCPRCRRDLALLEVTGHVIACDTDTPPLGEEFTDRLLACATRRARPWYRRRRTLGYVGSGLALAACVALAFTSWAPPAAEPEAAVRHTMVLGDQEVVSPEQLLSNIDQILSRDPRREDLRELAEMLRQRGQIIVNKTQDGAEQLENLGESTIMELLDAIRPGQAATRDANDRDADDEDL